MEIDYGTLYDYATYAEIGPASQWQWLQAVDYTNNPSGTFQIDLEDSPLHGTTVSVYGGPDYSEWLEERMVRLTGSPTGGNHIWYADPAEMNDRRELNPVFDLHRMRYDNCLTIVEFNDVAKGECSGNQSTIMQRSNYRRLIQDHESCADGEPCYVIISYSNVDTLAVFPHLACEDMIDSLHKLRYGHPYYDEQDATQLEQEEIRESWDQYLAADIRGDLEDEDKDAWDAVPGDRLEQMFWHVVGEESEKNNPPEHDGLDVHWESFLGATRTVERVMGLVGAYDSGLLCEHTHPYGDGLTAYCERIRMTGQPYCATHSDHPTIPGA